MVPALQQKSTKNIKAQKNFRQKICLTKTIPTNSIRQDYFDESIYSNLRQMLDKKCSIKINRKKKFDKKNTFDKEHV